MNVGKVVDKMTSESCILINSVRSGYDDYFSLIHNIKSAYIDLDKINPAYLVG